MPKILVDQIVFVWGCKQCTITTGQFTHLIYYYLKDCHRVHLVCKGLLYGNKDQTLLIDDELSKAFWNPKWSGLFLESFRGHELSKNKVQWLDLTSQLWSTLKGLPLAKMVYTHFTVLMQFRGHLSVLNIRLILSSNNLKELQVEIWWYCNFL
jgi:hypothetical protein